MKGKNLVLPSLISALSLTLSHQGWAHFSPDDSFEDKTSATQALILTNSTTEKEEYVAPSTQLQTNLKKIQPAKIVSTLPASTLKQANASTLIATPRLPTDAAIMQSIKQSALETASSERKPMSLAAKDVISTEQVAKLRLLINQDGLKPLSLQASSGLLDENLPIEGEYLYLVEYRGEYVYAGTFKGVDYDIAFSEQAQKTIMMDALQDSLVTLALPFNILNSDYAPYYQLSFYRLDSTIPMDIEVSAKTIDMMIKRSKPYGSIISGKELNRLVK